MQGDSPTDYELLNWINGALDVDSRYVRLHYDTMQANWHQNIEYKSMPVGMLKQLMLEKSKKEHLLWLYSTFE